MQQVIFLTGLPASGKSTYAKELVKKDPSKWVRVNKDSLRWMFHDYKWSRGREKVVEESQLAIAREALSTGKSLIVDNTNFSERHKNIFSDLSRQFKAEFSVVDFDTTVEECIKRDQERGKSSGAVGKDVILRMFYQYKCLPERPPTLSPSAYIFDIDGTLATMTDRGPFEWDKVGNDLINKSVRRILNSCKDNGYYIILVSGRDSVCLPETTKWLSENDVLYDNIFMREQGNTEPDTKIKKEIFQRYIEGEFDVVGVFDDRPCMVRMWRSLGLFCFDCGNGIEF